MSRALTLALCALALEACTSGASGVPLPPAPLPDEVRLGDRLTASARTRRQLVALGATESAAWVAVWLSRGFDDSLGIVPPEVRLFRRAWGTGPSSALPSAPLPAVPLRWATMASDDGAILLTADGDMTLLAHTDGTTWTSLPGLLVPGTHVRAVLARDRSRVVVRSAQGLQALLDGEWREVKAPGGPSLRLGPWDDSGLRVLYVEGTQLCSALVDVTGATGPSSGQCLTTTVTEPTLTDGLNGTPADFQSLVASGDSPAGTLHVVGGAPTLADAVPSTHLSPAPGHRRVVALGRKDDSGNGPTAGGYVEAGKPAGLAFPLMRPSLACACNRQLDATCGCATELRLASFLGLVDWLASPDGRHLALVGTHTADGQTRLHLKDLALPVTTTDFGMWCTAPCRQGEICAFLPGSWAEAACTANPW